ncbi:MAG: four helix bundle protein [Candidatus Cloacimonadales bacterium]|nr:four helix bundle protein [Candidatus Cloacimonadales bacterium]
MANISCFEDLEIWQLSRIIGKKVFEMTNNPPFSKDFKFVSQIRSAVGSVMDNIAEGFERDGRKEFIQFLYIAKGSSGEARSQSYRAFDFNYISQDTLDELKEKTNEISSEIGNFIKYLKNSELKGAKFKK